MRFKKAYLIYIALGISVGLLAFSSLNQGAATTYGNKGTIWKDEILIASGYWQGGQVYNPFRGDISMPALMMYDCLFGHNNTDPSNPKYISILGESFAWSAAGKVINITMKDATVAGGPKWSDGQNIDTADLNFTYSNLGGAWDEKVDKIEIISPTKAGVILNDTCKYSQEIWDFVSRQRALVPEHVWSLIKTSEGGVGLDNVWHNGSFPDAWKVCSGPYQPYYAEPWVEDIFVRRDNYWDTSVDMSKRPKYIAHIILPNNNAAATAMAENKLDYSGQYMSQVWEITARNGNVTTWYDDDPSPTNTTFINSRTPYYPSESSVMELMFNPRKFPMTLDGLRMVFAQAIDYDAVLQVAGTGYFRRAPIHRIDNLTTAHVPAYGNGSVDAQFNGYLEYNPNANLILPMIGVYANGSDLMIDLDSGLGTSYVDVMGALEPETLWLMNDTVFSGGQGNLSIPAAQRVVDYDGAKVGCQTLLVPQGTLKIDTVSAWSDFNILASQIALDINNGLGIPCVANPISDGAWGGAHGSGNDGTAANVTSSIATYDMSMHTGSPKTQEPAYRAFTWMTGVPNTWGGNTQNWKYGCDNLSINPFYDDAYKNELLKFDNSSVYSWQYNESAYNMKMLLATEVPAINVGYNCMWYTVNTKYFKNWPTESNKWLHVVPPWANYNQGAMSQMILGLESTGAQDPLKSPLPFVPVLMGLVGLAMIFAVMRRRRK